MQRGLAERLDYVDIAFTVVALTKGRRKEEEEEGYQQFVLKTYFDCRCTHHRGRALQPVQPEAVQLHRAERGERHRPVAGPDLRGVVEDQVQERGGQHHDGGDGPGEQHRLRQPLLRQPAGEEGAVRVRRRTPHGPAVGQAGGQAAAPGRLLRRLQELDNQDGSHRRAHRHRRGDQEQV